MASPMNSLIVPLVPEDHRGHAAEVSVEQPDHLLGAETLGEPGEAAQVRHQDGHGPDLAAEPQRTAVPDALLRELGAHVAPQHVPDEVPVTEPLHHLGHGPGQRADLVAAPRHDGHVEVALADPARLRAELAERLGDPPHQHDASGGGEDQRQEAEPRGPPRLRVDGRRVVALGHHHGRHPSPVPDRERRGPAEVALPAPLERAPRRHVPAQTLHRLRGEHRVLARRPPGRIDAARRRDEEALFRRDEHPAPRGHAEVAHEPGQLAEGQVHREDPAHGSPRVEERHRAGDPEPSVVEAIGLGPRHTAPRDRQPEERLLARTVAVVVGLAHALPAPVGQDAILLEPDAAGAREAPVQVELLGAVIPGAHEPVVPGAVADPAQLGIRVQHAQRIVTERLEIVGIQAPARDEARSEPHGVLGVAEKLPGMVGGHARGLRHRVVHQGARPGVLLPPRQGSEGGASPCRQEGHQAHQGERDRRPAEGAARERLGPAAR